MALVKYNDNSISAVTSTALAEGSLVPIKTLTASGSASLSFVHGSDGVVLDSTYPIYKFQWNDCNPATDDIRWEFQGSTNGGSSYGVTMTSTKFKAVHLENDTYTDLSYLSFQDLAQSTSYKNLSNGQGNGADECCVGTLYLFNPSSPTFVKHWMARTNMYQTDNYPEDNFCAGYFNTTSSIDAIQFRFSSGNIDSGTIKLYGIKDS